MILFLAGNKESQNRERDRRWNNKLTYAQQPMNENWLSVCEIPKPSAKTICYHERLDTGRLTKLRTAPFFDRVTSPQAHAQIEAAKRRDVRRGDSLKVALVD